MSVETAEQARVSTELSRRAALGEINRLTTALDLLRRAVIDGCLDNGPFGPDCQDVQGSVQRAYEMVKNVIGPAGIGLLADAITNDDRPADMAVALVKKADAWTMDSV